MRFGTVTLIGRTNVGKSTFLNWALGERLAITSPLPQTTRDALLGVLTRPDAQLAFLDTPGLHQPRTELGRRMNVSAYDSLTRADVVVMVTDIEAKTKAVLAKVLHGATAGGPGPDSIRPGDAEILKEIARYQGARKVLLINKVDRVRDKAQLLPMLEAYQAALPFDAMVPTSLTHPTNLDVALEEISRLLPEAPRGYEPDTLTNRPVLFFAREYVREAILNQLGREVPHAVAVTIDKTEDSAQLFRVQATIHVEKTGQRKIMVGEGGSRIKVIGTAARLRLEELVEKKVYLELFVRITPQWKDTPRKLKELGYDETSGTPPNGEDS
jgi:GTPase